METSTTFIPRHRAIGSLGITTIAWLVLLLLPAFGQAALEEHGIQVDFAFDASSVVGKQLAGYRLYKEGELICESGPIEEQSLSCSIASTTGTFAFTLSAYYDDGTESPQSAPFDFTIFGSEAPILGLQVLTGQPITGISGMGNLAGTDAIELADVIHLLRQAKGLVP
jgi:hypothetical protein